MNKTKSGDITPSTNNHIIAVHERQLDIANRALTSINRTREVEFFRNKTEARDGAISLISHYHPLSVELIERYKDKWRWGKDGFGDSLGLSGNPGLPWSIDIKTSPGDQIFQH